MVQDRCYVQSTAHHRGKGCTSRCRNGPSSVLEWVPTRMRYHAGCRLFYEQRETKMQWDLPFTTSHSAPSKAIAVIQVWDTTATASNSLSNADAADSVSSWSDTAVKTRSVWLFFVPFYIPLWPPLTLVIPMILTALSLPKQPFSTAFKRYSGYKWTVHAQRKSYNESFGRNGTKRIQQGENYNFYKFPHHRTPYWEVRAELLRCSILWGARRLINRRPYYLRLFCCSYGHVPLLNRLIGWNTPKRRGQLGQD